MLFAPALLALAVQAPPQAPTTLADLVPRNTIAFVQAPSLERAAQFVGRIGSAFGPPGGPKIDAATLMAMVEMPGDVSAVDLARPVGVCLVLEETVGAEPLPVFLVPVSDADKYQKSVAKGGSGMQVVAKGGYACVGLGAVPELPSAPAAIAKGLPEGEIAARIDLGRLVEQFREPIDQGLNELEAEGESLGAAVPGGIDAKPVLGAYADFLRDIVDSVETLDLGLRLDGDVIETGFALTNAEGSALSNFGSKEKTGLRALAGLLETDSGMSMLMGMDMAALMKRFQPLLDAMPSAYPEPMRPAMKQLMSHVPEFYGLMGTAQAAGMDFTDTGMRYRVYTRGGESVKLLQAYRTLAGSMPGFSFTEVPPREVTGVKIEGLRFKLDLDTLAKLSAEKDEVGKADFQKMMDKLLGKDGLLIQVASKDGTTMMVMGGDDEYLRASLARISARPEPPAFLARALQQVGDLNPCMIVHYDLGRMLGGMQDLMADVMPMGTLGIPSIALATTMWGGVDGRVWRGALELNLSEIAALARMGNQAAAPSARVKAQVDITMIAMALEEYAINNSGHYPESLEVLVTPDANGRAYLEGYDGKIPKDPWHNEYRYEMPGEKHPKPRVFSYGSDGAPGGTGDAADIDSDKLGEDDR